jgi:lipopolysaccharide export system permease protein
MAILIRYLIRAHVGPFLFALFALTGLLFVNAIAQKLQDLMGKGLTRDVIIEVMYLSIPHTVALTVPMAVLVAVLYVFSDLAANNELTAMKAGGVQPQRLLMPLLGVGTIVALLMYVFHDRVLPETNHRLALLLLDIGRKTPTLQFREQVVNPITLSADGQRVFLVAERIDNARSTLHDVEIVDPTNAGGVHRTLADSAFMRFNAARTDLYLVLFDGVDYSSSEDPAGSFKQMYFTKQIVPLRGIATQLERQLGGDYRGDREMTMAMLDSAAAQHDVDAWVVRDRNLIRSRNAVRFALGHAVKDRETFGDALSLDPSVNTLLGVPLGAGSTATSEDFAIRRLATATRSDLTPLMIAGRSGNSYRLEIHKKLSLAVACIVFVLIGAPLAMRFPRGGLGMVIAISSTIFAIYWIPLIGGEKLGNVGIGPPWLGMWLPNAAFGLFGLLLMRRMGHESATTRGGDWDDLLFTNHSCANCSNVRASLPVRSSTAVWSSRWLHPPPWDPSVAQDLHQMSADLPVAPVTTTIAVSSSPSDNCRTPASVVREIAFA